MDAEHLRKQLRTAGRVALGVTAAGSAAFAYGSLIERNLFGVREETLAILPPGRRPLRILHLSDIHMTPGQKRKQQWLRSLASLEPDLVVNTGDNLSHRRAVEHLQAVSARILEDDDPADQVDALRVSQPCDLAGAVVGARGTDPRRERHRGRDEPDLAVLVLDVELDRVQAVDADVLVEVKGRNPGPLYPRLHHQHLQHVELRRAGGDDESSSSIWSSSESANGQSDLLFGGR